VGIQEILKNEQQYIRVDRNTDSDVVLIIFSHVGYPAGKFAMSNALADIQATKIFVNCRDDAWYQQGIEGVAPSVDESVTVLSEVLAELSPAKVFSLGMSMGGYAALLFGLKLKCDAVLTFTAEVVVGQQHLRSYTLNKRKVYDYKYRSLANLVWGNSKTRVFGVYGTYDLSDLALLSNIAPAVERGELFTLHLVSGGHQATHRLHVPSIVAKLVSEGTITGEDVSKKYALPSLVTADELALYAEIQRCRLNNDNAAEYELLKTSDLLLTRPNLGLWLANVCIGLRKLDVAERALLDAIKLDPVGHELYHALGVTYFASRDFAKAVPAFEEAIRLDSTAFMSHFRLGLALIELGDTERAKTSYRDALRIHPTHAELKERLRVLEAA
jgi:tetratricopeptide (TPR) repeat protein